MPTGSCWKSASQACHASDRLWHGQVGELINERYEVKATHGKGVFSTVLLARDRSVPEDHEFATVAIKARPCTMYPRPYIP